MKSDYTVTQLSPGPLPSVHRYYDVPVEEPPGGGGRILYFRFDSEAIPGSGTVVVADGDGRNPRDVGRAEEAIGHVGGNQCWVGPGRVAFSPRQQSEGTSVIVELSTGESRPIESNIRSLCEKTGQAVIMGGGGSAEATALKRIQSMRLLDTHDGSSRPLLTAERAWAIHPRRDEFDPSVTNFQNAKFSPDGEELFVVFGTEVYRRKFSRADVARIKCLLRMDTWGEDLTYLGEFGHHPMWLPDGSSVIAYDRDERGAQHLMRYAPDGSGREIFLSDSPGVHCSPDRSGRRLVTDVFGAPGESDSSIVLIDVATGAQETLAAGRHERRDHMTGCHPHPQWSRDESRIFFNLADGGVPQLYAVEPPANEATRRPGADRD